MKIGAKAHGISIKSMPAIYFINLEKRSDQMDQSELNAQAANLSTNKPVFVLKDKVSSKFRPSRSMIRSCNR